VSSSGSAPRATLRRLLRYVRPHWGIFVGALVAMTVTALTQPAFAALLKPLLNGSFAHRPVPYLRWIPLFVFLLFVVRGLSAFASNYGMAWVGRRVIERLRGELFDHLLGLPAAEYDRRAPGTLVSIFSYNAEQVAAVASGSLTVLVRDALTVLGLVAWLLYLDPLLALTVFVVAPPTLFTVRALGRRFRSVNHRIQTSMGEVTRLAEEAIASHVVVKTYGGRAVESARFAQENSHNTRLNIKLAATMALSSPAVQFVAGLGLAAIIELALFAPLFRVHSIGTFVSFLGALLLLLSPLKHLSDVNAPIQRGLVAAASIFAVLDLPSEPAGPIVAGPPPAPGAGLVVRGLRFAYPGTAGEVLAGVDLDAPVGRTTALVGRSGSGKSTLAELALRLYEPTAGTILFDGRPLAAWPLGELRRRLTYVAQDTVLFNTTLRANLLYGVGRPVSGEALEEILAAFDLLDDVRALAGGLDAPVGERGGLLSGGQRQRVALARALLRGGELLILDEATSALDARTERRVIATVRARLAGAGLFVIAHRFTAVEQADEVHVLEDGRIVEHGPPALLAARAGPYAALRRAAPEGG
jgi:subfamily B ATP-binding cassette protein MsbA